MKENSKKIKVVLIAFILIIVMGLYVGICYKYKDSLNTDFLIKLMPEDRKMAILTFLGIYFVKGFVIVFPTPVLSMASGIIFGIPLCYFVSITGTLIEFATIYFVGRLIGHRLINWIKEKYEIIDKIESIQNNNVFFVAFLFRIVSVIPYDIGSLYFGASESGFLEYLSGSILAASVNIVLMSTLGEYILKPYCWQFWLIIMVKVATTILAYIIRGKINNKKVPKND